MKQLFQKKPFAGWLILFAILLSGAIWLNRLELVHYQPSELARLIEQDFNKREHAVRNDYARQLFFQKDVHINENPADSGFYLLHVFKNKHTYYWNSNLTATPPNYFAHPEEIGNGRLVRLNNAIYYIQYWVPAKDNSGMIAYSFIPVATDYSIENKYFRSEFIAGDIIPEGTRVSEEQEKGAIAINDDKGKTVFFVTFRGDTLQSHIPGTWLCLLFVGTIVCFAVWLHKICLEVGKKTRPVYGLLLLVFSLFVIFLLIRITGILPFDIRNTKLFSPQLLSSGERIKSFGDLLRYALGDGWVLSYLFINVPLGKIKLFKRKFLNISLALLLCYLAIGEIFTGQIRYMHLLIIDSKIPFELADFSGINIYTFLGLLAFTVITFNFILLLCIYIELCKTISESKYLKFVLLIGISILLIVQLDVQGTTVYYMAVTMLALIGVFLLDKLGFPMRPMAYFSELAYSSRAYIWFAVICSWITIEIFYFNYTKEKDLRKVFAQKLEQKQDIVAQFAFSEKQGKMAEDLVLRNFLKKPIETERNNISKYLYYEYLSTPFKKYRVKIYLYDRQKLPIDNPDTADALLWRMTDSIRLKEGDDLAGGLVYLNEAPAGYIYYANIPVLEEGDTLGYAGISLSVDQNYRRVSDPLYLKNTNNPTDQQYFDKYNFAFYKNSRLVGESGNGIFPYAINKKRSSGEFTFKEQLNQSILYYKVSDDETICVVYKRRLLINAISVFSYVLAVVVLISICYLLLRHFVFNPVKGATLWRRFNLTIRAKVNLTILATVFLSFVILGIMTVSYLISRYRETQQKNLQNAAAYISRSIIKSVEEAATDMTPEQFIRYVQSPAYNYRLIEIADDQNVDVNIYGAYGLLKATSQQDFNQKGYLSRLMNREAFEILTKEHRTEYTHIEMTGSLPYQSSYTPIKNKRGVILGFVNVPYYTSQTGLSNEISNILAVLINLYTFIFFLSGISAVLISNNVIKSFNLLINQFKNIRLRHNEPLQWPYKDEIGMLVSEYNAMIQKVEGMATRLANSEREAAWREIAKQVAHEIKNPLTPMKLQIQYLQQSMEQGRQDVSALTIRVTAVLLEQIEHLSIIASEFSNFAKLPEANPEKINTAEILQSLAVLYHEDVRTRIVLHMPQQNIYLWVDKSYMIRILTNIVQNAVQAIPEDREGVVEISSYQEERYAVIAIKDNGTGIPAHIRNKLFLPYFTTKSSGTGLGLSMTKNMIELSNGSIALETEEDKGTTFFVRIPLAE